jgi:hypothetical protein
MDRSTVAGMLEKIKTDKDFNIQKGTMHLQITEMNTVPYNGILLA